MVLLWTASCEVLPPQPGSPVVDGAKFCLWFQSLKVQIARISKMWSPCIPSETLIVLWKGKGFFKSSLHDFAGSSLRWRVHQGGTLQLRCQPHPRSLDWRHASMSWKQPLDWCTRRGDTCHDMNEGRDTWHACDWVLSSKMLYCSLFIFSHFLGFGVTCSRRSDDSVSSLYLLVACSQAWGLGVLSCKGLWLLTTNSPTGMSPLLVSLTGHPKQMRSQWYMQGSPQGAIEGQFFSFQNSNSSEGILT